MREQYEKYVGKKAQIWAGGLKVDVTIVDFKNSYGKDRYLVKPIAGEGQVWIENIIIKQ